MSKVPKSEISSGRLLNYSGSLTNLRRFVSDPGSGYDFGPGIPNLSAILTNSGREPAPMLHELMAVKFDCGLAGAQFRPYLLIE
jgi:hypothetical protein